MYKNMLPIGSIITVKGTTQKIMICGRIVTQGSAGKIYDYCGCDYPVGIVDSNHIYFFNREIITSVVYRGYEGEEELQFRKNVLDPLGKVKLEGNRIVPEEFDNKNN